MRRLFAACLVACLVACVAVGVPATGTAQMIRGTVLTADGSTPVAGAVVILRDSIGARPVPGGAPSPVGCYLAPSEPLSKFDPPRLTFRVNTGTPPVAETQTNDNEITL